MIDPPVEDTRIHHPESSERDHDPNHRARDDVVPGMRVVSDEGPAQQHGAEDGDREGHELPQGSVIVGEDLELRVEI